MQHLFFTTHQTYDGNTLLMMKCCKLMLTASALRRDAEQKAPSHTDLARIKSSEWCLYCGFSSKCLQRYAWNFLFPGGCVLVRLWFLGFDLETEKYRTLVRYRRIGGKTTGSSYSIMHTTADHQLTIENSIVTCVR